MYFDFSLSLRELRSLWRCCATLVPVHRCRATPYTVLPTDLLGLARLLHQCVSVLPFVYFLLVQIWGLLVSIYDLCSINLLNCLTRQQFHVFTATYSRQLWYLPMIITVCLYSNFETTGIFLFSDCAQNAGNFDSCSKEGISLPSPQFGDVCFPSFR